MSLAIVNEVGMTGTVGAMFQLGGRTYFVTCHHVLFGEGRGTDRVWAYDTEARARIAEIGCFVWGRSGRVTHRGSACFVDVALGIVFDSPAMPARVREALNETTTLGSLSSPVEGSVVEKRGAATLDTRGTIVDCRHYECIDVGGKSQHAPGQLLIRGANERAFCAHGDSGAAVVDAQRRIVALLWGCNRDGSGCASPIEAVVARIRESDAEIRRASEDIIAKRAHA